MRVCCHIAAEVTIPIIVLFKAKWFGPHLSVSAQPWALMTTRINLDYCKLPPYPEHGLYVVAGDASAKPGDERASASLEYACRGGYSLVGKWRVRCENGTWHDDAPQCLKIHAIESIGFADIVHDVVVILNDVFD
ncbi:hypothetical protein EVAR_76142_1 [Eumeta japonica]|uniref:Sushi domain-containing protein n=1 Tax=Eumeta variegata TaxID=151549 RepID=A0A4C1UWE2_EUMVA|nr:hypothetical protein EVAR_76142_1 [Eumeta japonica]